MKQRKRQTIHTFQIESLIDPEGTYVGTFCAMTGELLYHSGNEPKQDEEEETELSETISPNQLNLFA